MIRQKRMICFPGKKKAFTISYDDAVQQDKQLIDRMEKYRIRGTFNVPSGWLVEDGTVFAEGEIHRRLSLRSCKEVYSSPLCEVATHGFTHPFLTTMEPEMIINQIICDRIRLEEMFEMVVKGHAYPYGNYNRTVKEALRMSGIHYARTVHSTGNFELPEDWLVLNPTCHHEDEKLEQLTWKFLDEQPQNAPWMFYVWGHTFEFEKNDNWYIIENLFRKISGNEEIWYATNGEIYDYVKSFHHLEWSADGTKVKNPSSRILWVEIDGMVRQIKPGFQTLE